MSGRKGLDQGHAQQGRCLVTGCARKAIYRSGQESKTGAGYCSIHKDQALYLTPHMRALKDAHFDRLIDKLDR